jgi:hypothetical protein
MAHLGDYQAHDSLKIYLYVQPDTCPLVHTIAAADMHGAVTVFVTDALTGFRVSLCFYFE